jgi:hypothetical protein
MYNAGFVELQASADFFAPGSIEINQYQSEITDLVRRRELLGQRINQTPATGHPSRYFEQLAIPTGAFSDPRAITAAASQPKRVERPLNLKAITGQINYGLFDNEVTQQQGQFNYLQAKDLADLIDGVLLTHDQGLWSGNDTDLVMSTTNQYMGISAQLFNGAALAGGNAVVNVSASGSIVDAIKSAVAAVVARKDFQVRPTAIYANPMTLDLLDKEAKGQQEFFDKIQITPGVIVEAIPTQAGILPLIGDAAITVQNNGNGTFSHTFFIVTEKMLEYHYLTSPLPRVFGLGLQSNLASQYTCVKFGAVVAKAAGYAHQVVVVTR